MGALHEGHLSLMRSAVQETDLPVASIFVNPTQFSPQEDLGRYPRQEKRDLELCAAEGIQVVFLPTKEEMYPPGYRTWVEVEGLGEKLCGKSRPHHFRGVTTVVNLLFHVVHPDKAYFGLKDRQQYLILCRMVKDMGWDIEMKGLPTVREADGLALSSRNTYLSQEDRRVAPLLYASLQKALQAFRQGVHDPVALRQLVVDSITSESRFRLDYAEVVQSETLDTPPSVQVGDFLALAAYLGNTRLIDNIEFE